MSGIYNMRCFASSKALYGDSIILCYNCKDKNASITENMHIMCRPDEIDNLRTQNCTICNDPTFETSYADYCEDCRLCIGLKTPYYIEKVIYTNKDNEVKRDGLCFKSTKFLSNNESLCTKCETVKHSNAISFCIYSHVYLKPIELETVIAKYGGYCTSCKKVDYTYGKVCLFCERYPFQTPYVVELLQKWASPSSSLLTINLFNV